MKKSTKVKKIVFSKATPEGVSAISIIKITGDKLISFIKPLIKKKLKNQKMTYTDLYNLRNTYIDKILIVYFKSPNSFTGEDIIEFHLHGNEFLSNKLIKFLKKLGAKPARPGEFLERRYLNGKISLMECEMINNKIFYNNENMFKLTIEDQKNFYLCVLNNTKFKLNILIICLEIIKLKEKNHFLKDFVFIKIFLKKLRNLINILKIKIDKIDYLKNKFEIMIIGRRNVGKSTLFNKLCLQYDSIVTNIPGTTKNTITKQIYFASKKIILNDTAGIKIKTNNLIEKIGIMKNINNLYKSNLVLYLVEKFDLKKIFYNAPKNFFNKINSNQVLILVNKCDIFGVREGVYKINDLFIFFFSAKNAVLVSQLKCFISKIIDNENLLLNNKFCYSNINLLFNNCSIFYKEFCCSYDIMLQKTIKFQKEIYKMTGEYTNYFVINSLFRNFCMGK